MSIFPEHSECLTEEQDPGGWSGWQEIEVQAPELPSEEPATVDEAVSEDEVADAEGRFLFITSEPSEKLSKNSLLVSN